MVAHQAPISKHHSEFLSGRHLGDVQFKLFLKLALLTSSTPPNRPCTLHNKGSLAGPQDARVASIALLTVTICVVSGDTCVHAMCRRRHRVEKRVGEVQARGGRGAQGGGTAVQKNALSPRIFMSVCVEVSISGYSLHQGSV